MWATYDSNKCSIGEWAPFDIDHPTFFHSEMLVQISLKGKGNTGLDKKSSHPMLLKVIGLYLQSLRENDCTVSYSSFEQAKDIQWKVFILLKNLPFMKGVCSFKGTSTLKICTP